MDERTALSSLATALGVHTSYVDGLQRPVTVELETLARVCAALGAPIERPADAPAALRATVARDAEPLIPPVVVAWTSIG